MSKEHAQITLFQLKIHQKEGQEFENFFSKIMTYYNPNFEQVKPQGKFGDRKNDGFDKEKGVYYQVYAPEDIKNNPVMNTINKLNKTIPELLEYWDEVSKVKEIYFVINDKYKGVYADVTKELEKLNKSYPNVTIKKLLAKDLEKIFMENLSEIQKENVIGEINDEFITSINFEEVNHIVKYIFETFKEDESNLKLNAPDFNEKLEFNGLGSYCRNALISGGYNIGKLDEKYFSIHPERKQAIGEFLNKIYESALKIYSIPEDADKIFYFILEKICPQTTRGIRNSGIILMSKYFETCDIFEEPIEK